MKRRSSMIILAVAVGVVAAGVTATVAVVRAHGWSVTGIRPLSQFWRAGAKAAVDQSQWDLGFIEAAEEFGHKFLIRNEGDSPLQLARGPSTCKCTVAELPDEPIPPGGQAEVNVAFSVAAKRDTLKPGPFSEGVHVLTNDPDHPSLLLELKATVRRRLAAEPSPVFVTLHAADMSSRQKRSVDAVVYSQTWDRFDLSAKQPPHEGVQWRIEPAAPERLDALQARSGYRVEVTLPPDMPDGQFAEAIEFAATPSGGGGQPRALELKIQGRVDGRLTIFGRKVDSNQVLRWGALPQGESARENLLMKVNDECRSFRVRQIETEPAFLRARVAPYESGSEKIGLYRIEVELPGDAPVCDFMGTHAGVIRLKTDHPRLRVIEVKVDFAILAGAQRSRHVAAR